MKKVSRFGFDCAVKESELIEEFTLFDLPNKFVKQWQKKRKEETTLYFLEWYLDFCDKNKDFDEMREIETKKVLQNAKLINKYTLRLFFVSEKQTLKISVSQ